MSFKFLLYNYIANSKKSLYCRFWNDWPKVYNKSTLKNNIIYYWPIFESLSGRSQDVFTKLQWYSCEQLHYFWKITILSQPWCTSNWMYQNCNFGTFWPSKHVNSIEKYHFPQTWLHKCLLLVILWCWKSKKIEKPHLDYVQKIKSPKHFRFYAQENHYPLDGWWIFSTVYWRSSMKQMKFIQMCWKSDFVFNLQLYVYFGHLMLHDFCTLF